MSDIPVPVLKPEVTTSGGITGVILQAVDVVEEVGSTALGLLERFASIGTLEEETVVTSPVTTYEPAPVPAPVISDYVGTDSFKINDTLIYGGLAVAGLVMILTRS